MFPFAYPTVYANEPTPTYAVPGATPFAVYLPIAARRAHMAGVEIWPGQAVLHRAELMALHPAFVRTYVRWDLAEPEQGVYVWDEDFENDISAIMGAGAEPYVTIKMTPAWARVRPGDSCSRMKISALAAYGTFLYSLVKRHPEVKYWSIGNEPDAVGEYPYYGCMDQDPDIYAGMLEMAYRMIHHANGRAVVIAGELVGDGEFLDNLLDLRPPFDGFSFHYYASDLADDHELANECEYIPFLLRNYGYDVPIFLSETALKYDDPTQANEQAQADWVAAVDDFANDYMLAGFMWYALPATGWHNTGLMDEGGRRKAAFAAMEKLR